MITKFDIATFKAMSEKELVLLIGECVALNVKHRMDKTPLPENVKRVWNGCNMECLSRYEFSKTIFA